MTSTEIRETLHDVAAAVAAPTFDPAAFEARVGRARKRRTTVRVLGASTAAALVVAAVGGGLGLALDSSSEGQALAGPEPQWPYDHPAFAVSLSGHLAVSRPDGGTTESSIELQQVVGATDAGVVVQDLAGRVLLVPVSEDGSLGDPDPILGDQPVRGVRLSSDGATLGWVDVDDQVHLRPVGDDADAVSAPFPPGAELAAVDDTSWLLREGDRLWLDDPGGPRLELDPEHGILGAQVARDTVSVSTPTGVEFFSTPEGSRRSGNLGGSVGALSPDGRTYAGSPDESEKADGMRPSVFVMDTHSGEQTRLRGFDDTGYALGAVWRGIDRFYVLTAVPNAELGHPLRVLQECSVAALECQTRAEDSTGTLQLPLD